MTADWPNQIVGWIRQGCFVAGTDTGVGKTYVARRLLEALKTTGRRAAGYKPVCCGPRDDAIALLNASGDPLDLDEVNPCWFSTEAAPWLGAELEGRPADMTALHRGFQRLKERFPTLIVEGAGGWLVPIDARTTMEDLAVEWRLPVLLVAPNRLGVLNHTALTVHRIRGLDLECLGVALVQMRREKTEVETHNARLLGKMLGLPIVEIPFDNR